MPFPFWPMLHPRILPLKLLHWLSFTSMSLAALTRQAMQRDAGMSPRGGCSLWLTRMAKLTAKCPSFVRSFISIQFVCFSSLFSFFFGSCRFRHSTDNPYSTTLVHCSVSDAAVKGLLSLRPHPNTVLLVSRLPRPLMAALGAIEYLINVLRDPSGKLNRKASGKKASEESEPPMVQCNYYICVISFFFFFFLIFSFLFFLFFFALVFCYT